MNKKLFKSVKIYDCNSYKSIDVEKSFENLLKFQEEFGSIPIGDGTCGLANFNIFSTIMCIENIFTERGIIYGDIYIISDNFKFLYQLDNKTVDKMFYDSDRVINFIPIVSKTNTIKCFNIDNKFSNASKMRDSLVVESQSGVIRDGDIQLKLNICFKIPKGFKGDLNDAILEIYRYRTSTKSHDKTFKPDHSKSVYENWWDMVSTTDRRLFGEISLTELKDGVWTDIEK